MGPANPGMTGVLGWRNSVYICAPAVQGPMAYLRPPIQVMPSPSPLPTPMGGLGVLKRSHYPFPPTPANPDKIPPPLRLWGALF